MTTRPTSSETDEQVAGGEERRSSPDRLEAATDRVEEWLDRLVATTPDPTAALSDPAEPAKLGLPWSLTIQAPADDDRIAALSDGLPIFYAGPKLPGLPPALWAPPSSPLRRVGPGSPGARARLLVRVAQIQGGDRSQRQPQCGHAAIAFDPVPARIANDQQAGIGGPGMSRARVGEDGQLVHEQVVVVDPARCSKATGAVTRYARSSSVLASSRSGVSKPSVNQA